MNEAVKNETNGMNTSCFECSINRQVTKGLKSKLERYGRCVKIPAMIEQLQNCMSNGC